MHDGIIHQCQFYVKVKAREIGADANRVNGTGIKRYDIGADMAICSQSVRKT